MDDKADGGRVGLKGGSLKEGLERRNFLTTIVGNSPEAENARMLERILKEQKEFIRIFRYECTGQDSWTR